MAGVLNISNIFNITFNNYNHFNRKWLKNSYNYDNIRDMLKITGSQSLLPNKEILDENKYRYHHIFPNYMNRYLVLVI